MYNYVDYDMIVRITWYWLVTMGLPQRAFVITEEANEPTHSLTAPAKQP